MDKLKRLNSGYKTYKGIFKPKNPLKYAGKVDNIVYMSGWELKVMQWLDSHPDVIQWASEEFAIPYLSPVDQKIHRYYPDFFVKMKNKQGKLDALIIEVKPKSNMSRPKQPKKQTPRFIKEVVTYEVNKAKWSSATKFCEERGMKFVVMTEEHIFKKGS